MLNFLFQRLTPQPPAGTALFDAVTAAARQPHWYLDGQVPDTMDGRFRVLALTERFVEVMESEHREIGLGDPGLGRKVQKLVGSLAGRVELWRAAVTSGAWQAATERSLYPQAGEPAAIAHSADALSGLWSALRRADVAALSAGQIA
jgi:cytochrome b pre-mRNA-processing protein 3